MCNIKLATQTIAYIIWCKTVADALKINVGFRGLCPPDPPLGALPPDPGYRLALTIGVCIIKKSLE